MTNRYVTEKELEGHRRRVAAYRARKAAEGVKQISLMATAAEADQVRAYLAGIRDQADIMPVRVTPYSILANFTGLSYEILAKRLGVPWPYFSLLIRGRPTREEREKLPKGLPSDDQILRQLAQICADALAIEPDIAQDPRSSDEDAGPMLNFTAPVNNVEAREEFGYPSLAAYCYAVTPVMVQHILAGDIVSIDHRHTPLEAYWKLNTIGAEHLGTRTEITTDSGPNGARIERVSILQKNRSNLYFLSVFDQQSGPNPYSQLLSCTNLRESEALTWLEQLNQPEGAKETV